MKQECIELRRRILTLEVDYHEAVEASNEWTRRAQRIKRELDKAKRQLSKENQ